MNGTKSPSNAFMAGKKGYSEGMKSDGNQDNNPYEIHTEEHRIWLQAFISGTEKLKQLMDDYEQRI